MSDPHAHDWVETELVPGDLPGSTRSKCSCGAAMVAGPDKFLNSQMDYRRGFTAGAEAMREAAAAAAEEIRLGGEIPISPEEIRDLPLPDSASQLIIPRR